METLTLSKLTRALLRTGRGYRVANLIIDRHLKSRRRKEVVTEVLGLKLGLDPNEWVDRELLFYPSEFEPAEVSLLRRTVRSGDVFVDIGAHVGLYSLLAARAVGELGVVVAAEADPQTYNRLLYSIELNAARNIKPYNVGIADERGILKMYRYAGNLGSNSFIVAHQSNYEVSGTVDVDSITLLDLLRDAELRRVDFLKMDIESFEYRVMRRFLAESPADLLPRWAMVEYHPQYQAQAGGSVVELLSTDGRYREVSIPHLTPRDHIFERL